jgi:YidC/Oxa1 family membrane protein insertase
MSEAKRFFLSFLLSMSLILLWQKFFPTKKEPQVNEVVVEKTTEKVFTNKKNYEVSDDYTLRKIDISLFENFYKADNDFISFQYSNDGKLFQLEDNLNIEKEDDTFIFSLKNKKYLKIVIAIPTITQGKIFLKYEKKVKELSMDSSFDGLHELSWIGMTDQFSFLGIELTPIFFQIHKDKKTLVLTSTKPVDINFSIKILTLKKDYELLKLNGFQEAAGYGLLLPIALPFSKIFKFFYSFIPSYAAVIVLLTIIVRLLLLPLQVLAVKNMKKMQLIQPKLQEVKDRFKDNPVEIQKQTMEVFKKEKVNPFGGCLPLIIQMPVFFAFYSVLNQSTDLIGSSFLWIQDLSQKDPLYVMPILVGIAFFIQQKLTPMTNVDQQSQKVMMFVPIIFSFFMKDLASGLNLYMLVSTIIGFLSQKALMKYYG